MGGKLAFVEKCDFIRSLTEPSINARSDHPLPTEKHALCFHLISQVTEGFDFRSPYGWQCNALALMINLHIPEGLFCRYRQ